MAANGLEIGKRDKGRVEGGMFGSAFEHWNCCAGLGLQLESLGLIPSRGSVPPINSD